MMCTGCENRVKNALSKINGVKDVKADHKLGIVKIVSKKDINVDEAKEIIEGLEIKVDE